MTNKNTQLYTTRTAHTDSGLAVQHASCYIWEHKQTKLCCVCVCVNMLHSYTISMHQPLHHSQPHTHAYSVAQCRVNGKSCIHATRVLATGNAWRHILETEAEQHLHLCIEMMCRRTRWLCLSSSTGWLNLRNTLLWPRAQSDTPTFFRTTPTACSSARGVLSGW